MMIYVKKFLLMLPVLLAVFQAPAVLHGEGWSITGSSSDYIPPVVTVSPVRRSFSPNNDGSMDYAEFRCSMNDSGSIKGWRFQILQGERVIREYQYEPRNVSGGVKVFNVLRRFLSSGAVPDSFSWDGRNSRGMIMGNGPYRYSLTAWDKNDNISALKEGDVYIDTSAPRINASLGGYPSPGTVSIRMNLQAFKYDRVTGVIRDDDGDEVRRYQWKADAVPAVLVWDGKEADGAPAEEGVYSFSVEVADSAGNGDRDDVRNIVVERQQQPVRVDADCSVISYRKRNSVNFTVSRGFTSAAVPWKIVIEDRGGSEVRSYAGKSVPYSFIWDGKDAGGNRLRDGLYRYKAVMVLGGENIYTSPPKELRVDTAPPELEVRCGPEGFSPDDDRDDDMLTIRPYYSDDCRVKEWKLTVVDENGSVFYHWNGTKTLPERIIWNGSGYGSAKVESMKRYRFRLYAEDEAGNTAVSQEASVTSDILVRSSCEGFHIRLETGFIEGSDRPEAAFLPVLRRLADIVTRYDAYNIRLEVHTDVSGDDHTNLLISEKRAKYVADLLHGSSKKQMNISFRGMGETIPLVTGRDGNAGKGNNRIEITLVPRLSE